VECADSGVFKQCSCKKVWRTREEFLDDPEVEIIGYQVDLEKLENGFFLFNHHACKSTLGVTIFIFKDLYDGPVYTERKTGSEECPTFCLYKENLERCPAKCACAYVREIIQIIRARNARGK
jgi:hypothetical protein